MLAAYLSVIGDALDPSSGLPSRQRLDVVRLGRQGLLPYLWIMERGEDGLFRFRLSGEQVERTFGQCPRGKTLRDLLGPGPAVLLEADLIAALDEPALRLQAGEVRRGGMHYYDVRRLLVPMRDRTGDLRLVFGCFEPHRIDRAALLEPGAAFSIDGVQAFPVGVMAGIESPA